jgi:hypothetical protein
MHFHSTSGQNANTYLTQHRRAGLFAEPYTRRRGEMIKIVALLLAALCALMGTLNGADARELSLKHPPCGDHCPVRT